MRAGDVDARGEADDLTRSCRSRRRSTTSSPLVALTIDVVGRGVVAAAGRGEVGVTLVDVGAGQVVDGDGVGAAERVGVDRLDVVEVHHDVARCHG